MVVPGGLGRRIHKHQKIFNCRFSAPMEPHLYELPLKRLIDCARHQQNLCGASDGGLPFG